LIQLQVKNLLVLKAHKICTASSKNNSGYIGTELINNKPGNEIFARCNRTKE
jgi:hypothetical protein